MLAYGTTTTVYLVVARSAKSRVFAGEDFRCLLRLGVVTKREVVLVRRLPGAGGSRSLTRAHGLLSLEVEGIEESTTTVVADS